MDDLAAALRGGVIGRAGLDVFGQGVERKPDLEPLPPEHPLWDAPNFLMTPHVAIQGDPGKTARGHMQVMVDNVAAAISGEPLRNVVDKAMRY